MSESGKIERGERQIEEKTERGEKQRGEKNRDGERESGKDREGRKTTTCC